MTGILISDKGVHERSERVRIAAENYESLVLRGPSNTLMLAEGEYAALFRLAFDCPIGEDVCWALTLHYVVNTFRAPETASPVSISCDSGWSSTSNTLFASVALFPLDKPLLHPGCRPGLKLAMLVLGKTLLDVIEGAVRSSENPLPSGFRQKLKKQAPNATALLKVVHKLCCQSGGDSQFDRSLVIRQFKNEDPFDA